jgi:hypothetical protein
MYYGRETLHESVVSNNLVIGAARRVCRDGHARPPALR